jgi:hypothetical protein
MKDHGNAYHAMNHLSLGNAAMRCLLDQGASGRDNRRPGWGIPARGIDFVPLPGTV